MAVVLIDILDSAGQKQGSGPITSARLWRSTARKSRAGTFSFEMPASDPKAATVQKKRIARAYAFLNGERVEMGAGIIDKIQKQPAADGTVTLRVSGDDLLRELTYRSVLNLELYDGGAPVSHEEAVEAVAAYAPAGWTITPDSSPPNDSIYARFNGESVLSGLIKIADKSKNHFYRGEGRTLVFASAFESSGVRAVQARGNLSPDTCAIIHLTEQVETYDMITRIYPIGSGNGAAQLTLRATTRSAPAGYTLNAAQNYIERNLSVNQYGVIERQIAFRDIGPISNTDADIVAASNALFDAALEELMQRSVEIERAQYTMQLAGCSQLLRPMQTIRPVYRNPAAALNIDTDLNILEATWQADESGVFTTGVIVSTVDRWQKSDAVRVVDSMEQGQVYQALPQLNGNSYVIAYTKNIDPDETATFRFRFGSEITQLQQVLFEFQLLPFESTVKSIAGETTTSGAGGSSVESASSGGSHTHTVTIAAHSHTVTIAAHSHTVTIAAHSHTVTVVAHSHTVTISAHSHSVTIPSHSHTSTVPSHQHGIEVYDTPSPGSPSMKTLFLDISNEILAVGVSGTGNVEYVPTTDSENQHALSSSTASQVVNSSSDQAQTTPTSSTQAQTTPTSSTQAQTTPTSSEQAQTTPTSSTQAQTTPTSSSNGNHTHTVTIPSHTHTLVPVLSMVYGIFREEEAYTYEPEELEYRVNGGSWLDCDTATDAGDGWWQLDISSLVMDGDTFRPLSVNNKVEIRANATAIVIATWSVVSNDLTIQTTADHELEVGDRIQISGASPGPSWGSDINGLYIITDVPFSNALIMDRNSLSFSGDSDTGGSIKLFHTATIDAQLSVRNIIQAIAYV